MPMLALSQLSDAIKQPGRKLPVDEFLALDIPIVDVRSPVEFAKGHIPNAVNFPLFTDIQRHKIGTAYKKQGSYEAFLLGLQFIGPKMRLIVEQSEIISDDKKIAIYCQRGGKRSGSVGWLLEQAGFEVYTLQGGYKSFRQWVLSSFKKHLNIVILGGYTGSGKTQILQQLKSNGVQILDLEGIANHKGSAFGFVGEQPHYSHFENEVALAIHKLDSNRPLWIEDESRLIGRCCIPEDLWKQIRASKTFFLQRDLEHRQKILMDDYGRMKPQALINCCNKIRKRLGEQTTDQVIADIVQGNMRVALNTVVSYYDKKYLHGVSKRPDELVEKVDCRGLSNAQIVEHLLNLSAGK